MENRQRLCIRGGRVIDPTTGTDDRRTLWIESETIIPQPQEISGDRFDVLDATGCWVLPGIVDMHVHLREPGNEEAETIESGVHAAAAGGVTTLACMPNTTPPLDEPEQIKFVLHKARRLDSVSVHPIGAVSKGRAGEILAPVADLHRAGAVAISDDGSPIRSAALLRQALDICKELDIPVIDHCEDMSLSVNGVVREGPVSRRLGVPGIPAMAEEVMVARDIVVARHTGGRLHLAHLSTVGSVQLLRQAREEGLSVTGEVTPHHLALTHESLLGEDTNFKMNPPLGTQEDRAELIRGLADGTMSVIASDHAPHRAQDKRHGLNAAAFGVIGLETMLAVVITELVKPGHLSPLQAVACLTSNPAEILGLDAGTLRPGARADIVVVDPKTCWTVDPQDFFSKSKNTCFAGRELFGKVKYTLVGGRVVFQT